VSPGQVNYLAYAQSNFDVFTYAPTASQLQWFQNKVGSMVVWSPYFDTRTSWYGNAYFYQNMYGIEPDSWVFSAHPEWILHDRNNNGLYIPFGCGGGTCPLYAGDISNPAFRAYWISLAQTTMARGGYKGIYIDDVNMEFRVTDGWYNQIAPMDSSTGLPMTYDAWRSYVANFLEQVRAAFPNTELMENTIWYANGATTQDADPYIKRQISTSSHIALERGIANDDGLTGGTGFWSVNAYFGYVDRVHALGKGVSYTEYDLNPKQMQYGLAGYFLTSNGKDKLSDQTSAPGTWWSGYDVQLGSPLGARTYNSNGIYRRDFTGGIVLLGDPGLVGTQTVALNGTYKTLDGASVSSVSLTSRQGVVLVGSTSPVTTTSRYLSDLAPIYSVNGWQMARINQSVGGNPLKVNGTTYAHGLGVHAYSENRWNLNGTCSTLTAAMGLDDEAPAGAGSIDFQVWGDGHLLYDSGFMKTGTPVRSLNLNVTGIREISLDVTNGIWMAPLSTTYGDNGDWLNPVIVCGQ
jgi:hypothetical protein